MTSGQSRRERRGRRLRRVLLACLLAGAAAALRDGVPRECRDAVAASSKVSLCGPVGVADVRVGLFLLVTGVLLLGEAGEVQVAGLLTLKARVADAKAEAAEARREVAELRLSVGAAAGAAASARADVYVVDRLTATGEVIDLAGKGSAPGSDPPGPMPQTGPPMAVAAFHAGFSGLRSLLPEWARDATVIGYTLADDGRHIEHAVTPTDSTEGPFYAAILDKRLDATLVDIRADRWLVAARVVRDGESIGALAVVAHDPPAALGVREREVFTAAVEVLSAVYTRLLADFLGGVTPDAETSHGGE